MINMCKKPLLRRASSLRNYGTRGRQKTHDLWCPETHVVVQTPSKDGSVYAVAPVGQETKVKRVHHSLLEALVCDEAPAPAPVSSPPILPAVPVLEDEPPVEGDLFLKMQAPQ